LLHVQKTNQACRGSVGEKGIQERLHPISGDYVRLESILKLFLEKLLAGGVSCRLPDRDPRSILPGSSSRE
jgi:hypothetical protein